MEDFGVFTASLRKGGGQIATIPELKSTVKFYRFIFPKQPAN